MIQKLSLILIKTKTIRRVKEGESLKKSLTGEKLTQDLQPILQEDSEGMIIRS